MKDRKSLITGLLQRAVIEGVGEAVEFQGEDLGHHWCEYFHTRGIQAGIPLCRAGTGFSHIAFIIHIATRLATGFLSSRMHPVLHHIHSPLHRARQALRGGGLTLHRRSCLVFTDKE